jgi:cytidylate kinase
MSTKTIITIDGPAGSGKSTLCRLLARTLGLECLDTGAMYRALAWFVRHQGAEAWSGAALESLIRPVEIVIKGSGAEQRVTVNGQEVTPEIRHPEITRLASDLSARGEVRRVLTEMQRRLGARGGLVAEGRDMGTVVFPQARYKFYLEADLRVRAERRYRELQQSGFPAVLERVEEDMGRRDRQDSGRTLAPLRPAADAEIIDTSLLNVEEVLARMLTRVRSAGSLS